MGLLNPDKVEETMAEAEATPAESKGRTPGALEQLINSRHTRYRLNNVACICLRGSQKKPILDSDGNSVLHTIPAVFLSRVGDGKMGPFSEQFDTREPAVAEYVQFVDDWIAKNERKAKNAGISKMNSERPAMRIQNWDNMDVDQIRAVLEATQMDLTWAMEYELQRPSEIRDLAGQLQPGGVRYEVVDLIEDMYANGTTKEKDASQEAPSL